MTTEIRGCCCPVCMLGLGAEADAPAAGDDVADGGTRTLAAPVVKPEYSNPEVIYALTTGDGTFASVAWDDMQVTFSIGTGQLSSGDPEYQPEHDGYVALTPFMEQRAREAFQLWDDLIEIELVEMTDNAIADITFNMSSATSGLSYAQYSYSFDNNQPRATYTTTDVDIWLAHDWETHDEDADLVSWSSEGINLYHHEIGHALGLSHPGQYNISATYLSDATHLQDTRKWTVMSYFAAEEGESGANHVLNGIRSYGGTPLLHDILAAQAIYGADMSTRTGNTVYGFNSTAGREVFDFSINHAPVVAIWDAGGTDTLDVSQYDWSQSVDLNEGAFSSVGGLSDNVAIAHGASIERAVLGPGNDTIIGSDLSNALWGGAGDDTIQGGGGSDGLFGGEGADLIDGGDGEDWLRFTDATAGVQVSLQAGMGTKGEATGDTYLNIERVSGSDHGDTLQGDSGANQIQGLGGNDLLRGFGSADFILGGDGDDTLEGGTQNDIMRGGAGADHLDGGVGNDWAQYITAPAAVAVDLVNGGTVGEAEGDTFTDMENLGGSDFDDTLTGSDAPNIFLGEGGNDLIFGLGGADMMRANAGDDTLDGGASNDTLVGGPGADLLIGGDGNDWADYRDALGAVTVSLLDGTAAGADAEGDVFVGIEWLWGGDFADHLEGDDGTNLLRGGSGDDTITSHGGNDSIKGQAGADTFVFGPDDGLDRIFDFEAGTDLIHFASGTVSSFAELTINNFNGDASVVYDAGDTVILIGIAPGAVDPGWFTFA